MTLSPSSLLASKKIVGLIQSGGLFSLHLKGFEPRLQQQRMMENVIDAYNHDLIALIEAGTGTGKSLAYLIPALLWAASRHERTLISTHTIALQEQLVYRDIPRLLDILGLQLKAVLVKGMNQYLCLRKLDDARGESSLFHPEANEELERIEAWCQTAVEGARAEMPFNPSPAVWDRVGAENEACLHHQCPHYQQCYFFKARRQAQDAQVLVANHHLLFTDLAKRAEMDNYGETAILPPYRRVIVDEAHHLEDIATEHFAGRLSRSEFMRLILKLSADKPAPTQGKLWILKEKVHSFFSKSSSRSGLRLINRLSIELPALCHSLIEGVQETFDALAHFVDRARQTVQQEESSPATGDRKLRLLPEHCSHPRWQEEVVSRAQKLIELLTQYGQMLNNLEIDFQCIENDRLHEQTKNIRIDIQALALRLEKATLLFKRFFSPAEGSVRVRWIETQSPKTWRNVHLVDADLDVSKLLAEDLFSKFPTVVLCSATLTSGRKFDFMRQRLGLVPPLLPQRIVNEHAYDSPFNYGQQVLLAVPTDMPAPQHPDFPLAAFENIWNTLEASHGQAFVLFTSYALLHRCGEVLAERLKGRGYCLLKQGEGHRQELLERFKTTRGAVLFGTDSFWEGVDVIGDALRCVVIVKLPFKVPNEPMTEARAEAIRERGGDPFFEYAIPQAVVKFKQGFGRLIRHKRDRGCIVCLDTRLVSKGYGRLFLESLPSCERAFMRGALLWPELAKFYRRTYHFVKQNPFSDLSHGTSLTYNWTFDKF